MLTTDYNQLVNRLSFLESRRDDLFSKGNLLLALIYQGNINELLCQHQDEIDKSIYSHLYTRFVDFFLFYELEEFINSHYEKPFADILLKDLAQD